MSVSQGQIRPHLMFTWNDSIQLWHLRNAGGPPAPLQEHRGSFRGAPDVIPPSLVYSQSPTGTVKSGSVGSDWDRKSLCTFHLSHVLHLWIYFGPFLFVCYFILVENFPVVAPFVRHAWRIFQVSHALCDTLALRIKNKWWENIRNSVRRRGQNDEPATSAINQLCTFY